ACLRGAPGHRRGPRVSPHRPTPPPTPAARARHSAKGEAPARQTQSGRKEPCAKLSRCPDDVERTLSGIPLVDIGGNRGRTTEANASAEQAASCAVAVQAFQVGELPVRPRAS